MNHVPRRLETAARCPFNGLGAPRHGARGPGALLAAPFFLALFCALASWGSLARGGAAAEPIRLRGEGFTVEVEPGSGRWSLTDTRSGVRWPTRGSAAPGRGAGLPEGGFEASSFAEGSGARLEAGGARIELELVDAARALELRWSGAKLTEGEIRVLGDLLATSAVEKGWIIAPCREGLLIPAEGAKPFRRVFGTSDYEGSHLSVLPVAKSGAVLLVTWKDAYVFPELRRESAARDAAAARPVDSSEAAEAARDAGGARLRAEFALRRTARSLRLHPLGSGDWNLAARAYRRTARASGFAVTLEEKIRRDPDLERLLGAMDFKLWTCLARRRNEASTEDESVTVRWTFEEAARIAEHLRRDLELERCLFMIGGWTEGGYDCRHPDDLPANEECGGNDALAQAVGRIQKLGYIASLHDNYQDMYRDAKSWDPARLEKRADGSPVAGGRWLGGRAWMVCAPQQLELARRPENLPGIHELFPVKSYFIDTTFAVGPRECHDPAHPLGRNDDIAWKIRLSDYARGVFGLFGSECGREWALPHSDFFEGLVGVSGRLYHNLDPAALGATPIPFFEMVYHDCQIAWGKYGYPAEKAAPYVAHHVLCARPLHYHSVPDHLYWTKGEGREPPAPLGADAPAEAACARADSGWGRDLVRLDAFVKNTQEVLGPLHAATARSRLERFEYLGEDRTLRRATYGEGESAVTVTVNFSEREAKATSARGGEARLPPWGFVVDAPRFAAFFARSWGGLEYSTGALFTLRSLDGRRLEESARVRVFHGFGAPRIAWRGALREVKREAVVEPKAEAPAPKVHIELEEEVVRFESADNGAGPMWCHGNTSVVRIGDRLLASGLETLAGARPLNNCVPLLFARGPEGWRRVFRSERRTREPSPLACFPRGDVFLSVNPTLAPPDAYAGAAEPRILRFSAEHPEAPPETIVPEWEGKPPFTEHSYRSFAADGKRGELILFQNIGYEHAEWTFRDASGAWSARGRLVWPWGAGYEKPRRIRVCYPAVELCRRAVHFLGVSDIIEPNPAWRAAKRKLTGREWDYDFRRLFYTRSDDITAGKFHDWLEVSSREATCGWIFPQDLRVAPGGESVFVLWSERALDERLRKEFYPGARQRYSLECALLRGGRVVHREPLAEGGEGLGGERPGDGRFHVTPDGRLYAIYHVGGTDPEGKPLAELRIARIHQDGTRGPVTALRLHTPLSRFFTATVRAGCAPSWTIDLYGAAGKVMRYARVRIEPE